VRGALTFRFVSEIETVLDMVFGPALHERARRVSESPAAAEPDLDRTLDEEILGDGEPTGAPTPVETEG
jgi:hypothetical protein